MTKTNCWQFKNCGRGPGGKRVSDLGICPATLSNSTDGVNGGVNGGRACWVLSGTLCGGKTQGVFAQKLANCMDCDFYKLVRKEEGASLVLLPR